MSAFDNALAIARDKYPEYTQSHQAAFARAVAHFSGEKQALGTTIRDAGSE